MKVIIRVETIADWGETAVVEIYQVERPIGELSPETVGLSLADGKELLHKLQQVVIGAQSEEVCAFRRFLYPMWSPALSERLPEAKGRYGVWHGRLS